MADDERLESLSAICAGVNEFLTGASFEPGRLVLQRATAGGMTHVVFFYFDEPESEESPDQFVVQTVDTFSVHLGVRAEGFTRLEREAFPEELDIDLSTGLGETRKADWDPQWTIREPERAAQDIARLIDRYGEAWFAKFDSIEKTLATLESLDPADTTKTWHYPRQIAMRLRAQRGELDRARQDLAEHLAGRRKIRTRPTVYGVALASALADGVPIPDGTDAYVRLGQAWRIAQFIAQDHKRTQDRRVGLSSELDRHSSPILCIPDDENGRTYLEISGQTASDIAEEVAPFMLAQIAGRGGGTWPVCPKHSTQLHIRASEAPERWYCDTFDHDVARVGHLRGPFDDV